MLKCARLSIQVTIASVRVHRLDGTWVRGILRAPRALGKPGESREQSCYRNLIARATRVSGTVCGVRVHTFTAKRLELKPAVTRQPRRKRVQQFTM